MPVVKICSYGLNKHSLSDIPYNKRAGCWVASNSDIYVLRFHNCLPTTVNFYKIWATMSERIAPLTIPKHTVRYITERSSCNIVVLHYVCENTFVIPCTYNLEHA